MEEQEIMLKSYRREIKVLILSMDVPYYEDAETRKHFLSYEDVLTKLFNNKREEKDILEIQNYYNSDRITIYVNLTDYMKGGMYEETDEEVQDAIEHIKTWLTSGLDVSNDMVEHEIRKGYIYEIPSYMNNIKDLVNDEFIENYVTLLR